MALEQEIDGFDPELPIERAWTPPSSWYTSAALCELEHRTVFGRSWQPVARLDQLALAGAHVAGRLVEEPWLVVNAKPCWRERLWMVPEETRLSVPDVAEALGRSKSWVYKKANRQAGSTRLPTNKPAPR